MMYLSKSSLGVILIILFIGYYLIENINIKMFLMGVFISSFIIIISPLLDFNKLRNSDIVENSRGLRMVQKMTENNFSNIFRDQSFVEKITPVYVGLLSIENHPIGNGIGSYPFAAIENKDIIINNLKTACNRNDIMYDNSILPTCITKSPSALGLYLTEFGYLFVIFILFIFFRQNNYLLLSLFIKGIGFLIIFAGNSITFPLIWFIFALLSADEDNNFKSNSNNLY